jgi:hypothetical protein
MSVVGVGCGSSAGVGTFVVLAFFFGGGGGGGNGGWTCLSFSG